MQSLQLTRGELWKTKMSGSVNTVERKELMAVRQGVEPFRHHHSNRLMAHDFHDSCLNSLSRFNHSEFTPVDSCLLVPTSVWER